MEHYLKWSITTAFSSIIVLICYYLFGWWQRNRKQDIVLNYETKTFCERLWARGIWQALYPAYVKYGNLKDLDSFLCDLRLFEREIKNAHDVAYHTFYWVVDGAYTEVNDGLNVPRLKSVIYEVVVDVLKRRITIRRVHHGR